MIQRCYNPRQEAYSRYGALGVTVCDRWHYSFENFLADIGPRPKGKTLDRWPNPYGNYEPRNCQWSTLKEQIEHQDHPGGGKSVTVKGVPYKTVSAAARANNVNPVSVLGRMKERNETAAQAIHAIHKWTQANNHFLANSVATTARANNIKPGSVYNRVHRYGETPKEAIAALRKSSRKASRQ